MLTVGSLFSGIGGLELGLEWAGGFKTAWQCEIDPYCRRVLKKHWPDVPCYGDITTLEDPPWVDVICGGFPCPVVSQAARGRNVGEWFWPEMLRIVRAVRPRYVVLENVAGLLSRGRRFGDVLCDLAQVGFDAVWRVLRASWLGASHHRPRVWLVAHTDRDSKPDLSLHDEVAGDSQLRPHVRRWSDSPRGLGVADGISSRMDRLRGLGNAVVPQAAQFIGQRILDSMAEEVTA